MAVDTERKRWGMMQWACGPSYYPTLFNPDTNGVDATERATVLKLYGGIAWDGPAAEVALSTTITDEASIRSGGATITLELTFDTWVNDDTSKQGIIDGLDGDDEATGWDAVVQAGLAPADVNISGSTATITLPAFATFDITASSTVTATIPALSLVGATETVATPTFTVTFIAAVPETSTAGGGEPERRSSRRTIENRISDGLFDGFESEQPPTEAPAETAPEKPRLSLPSTRDTLGRLDPIDELGAKRREKAQQAKDDAAALLAVLEADMAREALIIAQEEELMLETVAQRRRAIVALALRGYGDD